jgi:hypothetical protein
MIRWSCSPASASASVLPRLPPRVSAGPIVYKERNFLSDNGFKFILRDLEVFFLNGKVVKKGS